MWWFHPEGGGGVLLVLNEGQYNHSKPLDVAAFLIDWLEIYGRH